MPAADLRGFRDPLSALRKQRQWRLDAALAEAGRVRRELTQATAQYDELLQEFNAQALRAAQAWTQRPDPVRQQSLLPYLSRQQEKVLNTAREQERLRDELARAQERVALQQQQLEMLERERKQSLAAFRMEQERKAAAESDREWIARGVANRGGLA